MKAIPFLAASAMLAIAAPVRAQEEAPVRLNQIGILAAGPKRAIVANLSKRPLPWTLTNAEGRVLASGQTTVFGPDRWSGEHVHQVDFSEFQGTGQGLSLKVGDAASRPFDVGQNLYDRLPKDALAYFYHNRAGTPIGARFVGERWARPIAHSPERATCITGADSKGNVWPGCPYTLDVTGGWYDAGDHGKYVVNGGIALWTLLNLHERQSAAGLKRFADGSAAIPERANGVPDLLDEARWEMDFLLKMQVPEGTRLRVPVGARKTVAGLKFSDIDASGMAHHKVADEKWTSLPQRPELDPERRILFPPSTAATLNLAASAAQCARVWRDLDRAYSERCLAAAERAWSAALRNPEVYALADFTGSGAYGDDELGDEFYWAAAELFATTGRQEFRTALERAPQFRSGITEEPSWPGVAPLGTITLATVANGLPASEVKRLRGHILSTADRFLGERKEVGYALPYAPKSGWTWGSTSNVLNRSILLALAYDFSRKPKYRDGVIDGMDFILGRNPLDRSFVTGYGARPMQNPHHRFWAHSLDKTFPPPPPGAISGGPNSTNMSDEVASKMKGKCAPQKCWVDDIHAFSMNEVAINWNAPLLWVSAWLADHQQAR